MIEVKRETEKRAEQRSLKTPEKKDEKEEGGENDRVEFIVGMVRGELEYNIGHNLSLSTLTDLLQLKILICRSLKRFGENKIKTSERIALMLLLISVGFVSFLFAAAATAAAIVAVNRKFL